LYAFIAAGVLVCAGAAAQKPAKPVPKPASGKPALDKATLEAFVRHLLIWNPQIQVTVSDPKPAPLPGFQEFTVTGAYQKAVQSERFYVSADGRRIVRGEVYDVNKSPFENELGLLTTASQPSLGTEGAPVVIVLFTDFQCPYCRTESKMLRERLIQAYPKEVRLYFKDFPLEPIHPWAKDAAIAGRCVFRQRPAMFWDYHDWIFDKQGEVKPENLRAKIGEWAQTMAPAGLDGLQLSRCIDTRATEPEVDRSIAEAASLKVNSTPTLFVNGRRIPGSVQWEQLKSIIDWELDFTRRTGIGGEKCCAVTLPTPIRN
jgi:protein-disulfide isomerase